MTTAWLHSAVAASLTAQADRHTPNETGGILLGYRHDTDTVVINDTIGPGPNAEHRPTGFVPDTEYQAAELAARYQASGRRLHYLGDWHTHPGGTTSMSRTDRRTLRTIARHPEARNLQPIMAILGGQHPWTIAITQTARRPLLPRLTTARIQIYP